MKNFVFSLFLLSAFLFAACSEGALLPTGSYKAVTDEGVTELVFFTPTTVRVMKYPGEQAPDKQSLSVIKAPEQVQVRMKEKGGVVTLSTAALTVTLNVADNSLTFADKEGKRLLAEKPQSCSMTPMNDAGRHSYHVAQTFLLDADEAVYGLGQHQQGLFNQRGHEVHLEQVNMEIAIPIMHSVKGYALFWDNYSITDFKDNAEGTTFASQVGDLCDYYFIYGNGTADGVIAGIRDLTGEAPMSPLWTLGFQQSRERYMSQDELVGVVRKYRELQVPLDGIIQDWQYWGGDNHWWNAVEFLNPGFPEPARMMQEVHALNAHGVISIWPSFGPNSNIHKELKEKNLLLAHSTFPQGFGVKVYDAYNPEARDVFWKYIRQNIYDIGMDGYWLDATEPEHQPIRPEDYDCQTYLGSFREVRNAFPIVSVGGVYDNQRKLTDDKRVFILTRSAFAGQQRYGAHCWSGDVVADWQVLNDQIPAGLNFSLCGIPYWNTDIGGFWTWQHFPDGYKDPAYQKLYVRWMQFATFTGMMRSHGTNTPREIFNFGERGYWAFDAQEKFINLRYRLIPYIYSMNWAVTSQAYTPMRALFMDYPQDKQVWNLDDEFLFGPSFLVAPVTTPQDERSVYLPAGQWIDFWTGETVQGGATFTREAPVDLIPLYVKAGSVVPVGPTVQYAAEKPWDALQIRVYPGANGEFTLYEDAGDGYAYEQGAYSTIRMTWDDARRQLTVHPRQGTFPGMLQERTFRVVVDGDSALGLDNESADAEVTYTGNEVKVNL